MAPPPETVRDEFFPVIIVTKSQNELVIDCLPKWHVKNLKWAIHKELKVCPKEQRLFFEGIELEEPDYLLSCYGIEPQPAGHRPVDFRILLMEFYRGIPQTYFLDEAHYDQKWNCSYEGIVSKTPEKRGGMVYYQPIGCVRYGVKVLGKYENDAWLGGKGYRTEDEWPVAYHGTKELNVLEILRKGFLLEKGVRFAFGKGIYCSPDPRVALGYAFHYEFNGEPYKLIIQCRVDPKRLQIHGSYWLVPDGTAIRPYGICVYSKKGCEELEKQFNGVGMSFPRGGYTLPGMSWAAQMGGGGNVFIQQQPNGPFVQQQPVRINPSTGVINPIQLNQQQNNGGNAAPHDQQVQQQQSGQSGAPLVQMPNVQLPPTASSASNSSAQSSIAQMVQHSYQRLQPQPLQPNQSGPMPNVQLPLPSLSAWSGYASAVAQMINQSYAAMGSAPAGGAAPQNSPQNSNVRTSLRFSRLFAQFNQNGTSYNSANPNSNSNTNNPADNDGSSGGGGGQQSNGQ